MQTKTNFSPVGRELQIVPKFITPTADDALMVAQAQCDITFILGYTFIDNFIFFHPGEKR